MEVAPCAPHVDLHAASLLKHLNLQREQAQFCDCVLRQRQGSGQLYPAHRCLLAASSPVLASIVSSSGVLVELQDPRLPDSVLAHLLDYIYTGVLPDRQEQYSRLLAAAIYLEMNELQDALSAFWKKTEGNGASDRSFCHGAKIYENTHMEALRINNDPQPSAFTESLIGSKETSGHDSANVEMFEGCSQRNYIKSKDLTQNISCNAGIKSWKRSTDKDLLKTSDKWISSSVSHPRYGAVPVICHSSRADVLRLADSPLSPYFPAASCKVPASHLTNGYKRSTGECVTGKHTYQNEQNQETVYNEKNIASTNPLVTDQVFSTIVGTDQGITSFSTNTGCNDHDHSDLLQLNPKFHIGHLASVKTGLNQGIKHKTDEDFGDFPSKHQHLDLYKIDVSPTTNAVEGQSDWNSSAQCLRKGPDADSKSCLEIEVKNEHSYSSRCLTERDTKEGNYDPFDGNQNSDTDPRTQKIRNDKIPRHEYDSDSNFKSLEIRRHSLDLCPTVSTTGLESDNPSEQGKLTQTVKSCLTLASPEENVSDFDPSNQKYFYYSCLQKDIDVIHKTFGFTCGSSGHSDQSDDLSDGCEADVLFISGQNSLKHHSDTDNSQQDFLLDTNTKPAERNGHEIKDVSSSESYQKNQWNNGLSTEEVKLNFTRKSPNYQTESFESVTKDHSSNESRTLQGSDMTEVSKLNEDENINSKPVSTCSSLIVPSFVQVSVQPTLTACVSSSSSGNMPTEKPASASSPAHHPFQCSLCDRSFSQRGSLNRHVRSHLGVRPFSCPFCTMTFSRQYRVTEHMRVHQRCALGTDFQKNR
ncbi:Hypermethylated in cancer 2 protein [Oryzias melastigma]|uniref:Hypermethylated in cancer 2 protein n=1 Tax=Oryzias melastigma TaxID=30732 RepID=A0A834FE02_ORYME|nr:Hypermethylated in cancer 2 protein [Oryzias melastigma]